MDDFNVDTEYKKLYNEHLEYFYDGFALNSDSIIRRYPGKFSIRKWIIAMIIGTSLSIILSFVLSFLKTDLTIWISNALLNFAMGFFVSLIFLIISDKREKLRNYLDSGIKEIENQYEKIDASLHLIDYKLSFSVNSYQQAYLYMRFAANAYLMLEEYFDELYKVFLDDRLLQIKKAILVPSRSMFEKHNTIYNPGYIDAYYGKNKLSFRDDLKEHVSDVRRLNLDIVMQMYRFRDVIYDIRLPLMNSKYSKLKKENSDE